MKNQKIATTAAIVVLVYLVLWLAIAARAQDEPICVPDQPCIAPAVTAVPTPTATPVMAPSPDPTPVIVRPLPMTPCKLSPGCVYMPVVMIP